MKKEHFSGRVAKKYEDEKNHAERTIDFENGGGYLIGGEYRGLWSEIQIGDTVCKRSGSNDLYLIRDGDSIVYPLDCTVYDD